MEWVNAVGFTLLSSLLVYCIKAIHSLANEVGKTEARIETKVAELVAKEKEESILAHRRLAVIDQTVSDVTEEKFNSRNIVEGKEKLPKMHRAIRRLLHESDK